MEPLSCEELKERLWDWLEKNENKIYNGAWIRYDDSIFHNVLEIDEYTGDVGVGLYSQNSFTPHQIQVYEFPNGQDIANMDSSEFECPIITHDSLNELYRLSDMSEERIEELEEIILGNSKERNFCYEGDCYGCYDEMLGYLHTLLERGLITKKEEEEIPKHGIEYEFVPQFMSEVIDEEIRDRINYFCRSNNERMNW